MGKGTPAQLKQVRTLDRTATRHYEEAEQKRQEAQEARRMADLSDPGTQRKSWQTDARRLEREAETLSNKADKVNAELYRLEEQIDPRIAALHKRQDELSEARSKATTEAEKEALDKEWWKATEESLKARDALEARAAGSQAMNEVQDEFDDDAIASADTIAPDEFASNLGLDGLDGTQPMVDSEEGLGAATHPDGIETSTVANDGTIPAEPDLADDQTDSQVREEDPPLAPEIDTPVLEEDSPLNLDTPVFEEEPPAAEPENDYAQQ